MTHLKHFIGLLSLLLLGISFSPGQTSSTPCNSAMRYEQGGHWKLDGSINDAPNAPEEQGIIRCGSSAETQSQINPLPGIVYDPTAFLVDISGIPCIDPSNGSTVFPLNPTNGEPIIWLNFDVRAFGGSFQTQINDNSGDLVAWALYSSDAPTNSVSLGATGDSLSGDCSLLTLRACGVESSSTWNTLPVPDFSQTTNYYIAIWDQNADGDLAINNFKTRFGCGDADVLVCNLAVDTETSVCNTDGTYTVTVPISGINGNYVGSDPNATPTTSTAICLTNMGGTDVTSGVITMTYPQGVDYNISISVDDDATDGCDDPINPTECSATVTGTAPACLSVPRSAMRLRISVLV